MSASAAPWASIRVASVCRAGAARHAQSRLPARRSHDIADEVGTDRTASAPATSGTRCVSLGRPRTADTRRARHRHRPVAAGDRPVEPCRAQAAHPHANPDHPARRRATSIDRNPSRASSISIARSRAPSTSIRSQLREQPLDVGTAASSAGSPSSRQPATPGPTLPTTSA